MNSRSTARYLITRSVGRRAITNSTARGYRHFCRSCVTTRGWHRHGPLGLRAPRWNHPSASTSGSRHERPFLRCHDHETLSGMQPGRGRWPPSSTGPERDSTDVAVQLNAGRLSVHVRVVGCRPASCVSREKAGRHPCHAECLVSGHTVSAAARYGRRLRDVDGPYPFRSSRCALDED